MTRSQILFYALMFYVAGIILGNFFDYWPVIFFSIALVAIWLALILKNNLRLLMIFLACVFFGLWRFQFSLPEYQMADKIYHYNSNTVEFIGRITQVAASPGWQTLVVEAKTIKEGKENKVVSGSVKLSAALYPEYQPGDNLRIGCRLKDYSETENRGYANYLFKENIFSTCDFAEIKLLDHDIIWQRIFYKLKSYAKERINLSLKEPAAAILNGMLLNDTKSIPAELSQVFSRLGLTHIIAISGSHLVIIIYILLEILIFFGLSRIRAFWPAIGFIIFYVVLVGAPASAVRSAVMVILMMYAQRIGRLSASKNLLVLAAAVMATFNPEILLFDVGFQLSFLAVVGLSYFSLALTDHLKFLPEQFGFREIAGATLSAQILTYPLIIFYFGGFSPYSLLANLLILPIVPFLMGWGIFNLAVALFWGFGGQVIGLLTVFLVGYWTGVSEFLVGLPGSYWQVSLSWYLLLLIYVVIFILYLLLTGKDKKTKVINTQERTL